MIVEDVARQNARLRWAQEWDANGVALLGAIMDGLKACRRGLYEPCAYFTVNERLLVSARKEVQRAMDSVEHLVWAIEEDKRGLLAPECWDVGALKDGHPFKQAA